MEIASTPSALHLFPKVERYRSKTVGCKLTDFSALLTNPNPQTLSRTGRDGKERCDVVAAAPKKRKHSDGETPLGKRQKKTIEVDLATKVKSKSFTTWRIRINHTKPGENRSGAIRDLIAKAQEKLEEKRKIDQNAYLANQRMIARVALNQVVATVADDDHLKYHTELQQLGCDFIRDQVSCLDRFNLLTRIDYTDESNSVLVKKEMPRSGEDSMSKKQTRSTKNGESAESSNQRKSKLPKRIH